MRRYRTEIVIPPDRYVGLQLPADLPHGRAFVTIQVEDADPYEGADAAFEAGDDIEWWEEFSNDPDGEEPWGLHVRLSALES